ncbi:hypothetical protein [Streptomyces sp. CNQ-509]|uniref:hypothetical protein n=1 Tax=Streptomyces sp. CNQ-509 TaxID=444103 RepID=UPI001568096D|nr:hypothetical protein [Streptomyces sp. CNQ-509]
MPIRSGGYEPPRSLPSAFSTVNSTQNGVMSASPFSPSAAPKAALSTSDTPVTVIPMWPVAPALS